MTPPLATVRRHLRRLAFALLLAVAPSLHAQWFDPSGAPTAAGAAALQLLATAADDGLEPDDYRLPVAADIASADQAMNAALQRYLAHLHRGRADPAAMGFRTERPAWVPPAAAALAEAASRGELPALAQRLRPSIGEYPLLRTALARLRERAAAGPDEPLAAPRRGVRPGDAYPEAGRLRERLVRLGDLPADAPAAGDTLDAALADALAAFQRRHGLAADGVLGAATVRALNVPLAERVRQVELSMERLRWLPPLGGGRWIGINIPTYQLFAVDPGSGEAPLQMAVVVGKALNTQTPLLHEAMRTVIFRPYWNVPRSIVRHELLPAIARDPGYLARHDMELVRGGGDDARPVAATPEHLAQLREGTLRLRQRPGPKNSLGLVKFVFPNAHDVYLHGTPAQSLFGRPRRDFSHGCVRLEDPVALATWVLREQPDWSRDRVEAAMTGGPLSRRVELRTPIPVLLFYLTALVGPGSEAVQFAEDVYGHDARLRRALAR